MKSVVVHYGWDCLWYVIQWKCHQTLCDFLYEHQEGDKVPIPTECPKDTHPLKVFEDTHVETNICRWVVFALWLKPPPQA